MKIFNKILMGSEFDVNLLKTGVFYDSEDKQVAVEDGAFVTIGDLENHDLYTGMKDFNARKITAYDEDEPIYGFIDVVEVSHADVMGVQYRIGDSATCS